MHLSPSVLLRSWLLPLLPAVTLVMLAPAVDGFQPTLVSLRSKNDCEDNMQLADEQHVYQVKVNGLNPFSPNQFTSGCLKFQSSRSDGRLCVYVRKVIGIEGKLKLILKDGYKKKQVRDGQKSEWCTEGRNLTVHLGKRSVNPDFTGVDIDLLISDLQCTNRRAYMDSVPSCGSSFTMDASRVTVTNVDPSSGRRTTNCGLTFSYTGQDVNRLMCLDFTTLSGRNPGCEFNYTLNVNVGSAVVDRLSCATQSPWGRCYNNTSLQLVLKRPPGSPVEKHQVFSVVVSDIDQSEEHSRPTIGKPPEDSTSSSPLSTGAIVGIAVSGAFVLITIPIGVLIYRRARRLSGLRDGARGKCVSNIYSNT